MPSVRRSPPPWVQAAKPHPFVAERLDSPCARLIEGYARASSAR